MGFRFDNAARFPSSSVLQGGLDATLAANLPTNPAPYDGDRYKITVAGDFENDASINPASSFFSVGDQIEWDATLGKWNKIDAGDNILTDPYAAIPWQFDDDNTPSRGALYAKFEADAIALAATVSDIYDAIDDAVDDTPYGVIWDGDTTSAPSMNAVYDKFVLVDQTILDAVDDTAYSVAWDGDTTSAPSMNAVYDKFVLVDQTILDAVDDTAYSVAWDGDTTSAPSMNAVYDKFVTVDQAILDAVDDTAYSAAWDGDTTSAPSKNAVYDYIETLDADLQGQIDNYEAAITPAEVEATANGQTVFATSTVIPTTPVVFLDGVMLPPSEYSVTGPQEITLTTGVPEHTILTYFNVGTDVVSSFTYADQAEAEAGAVSNKVMSPLRTAQAIAAQAINPVGTPLTQEVAVFTGANGVQGDSNLTWDGSEFTINGKLTVTGLIDPTGLQLVPQASNPGDAYTIWFNSADGNKLYVGAGTEVMVSGVSSHSGLTNLTADDHTIYVLADGTRDITGDLAITSVSGSISAATGALTVGGGVGIGENLYVGNNVEILGNLDGDDSTSAIDKFRDITISRRLTIGGSPVFSSKTNGTRLSTFGQGSIIQGVESGGSASLVTGGFLVATGTNGPRVGLTVSGKSNSGGFGIGLNGIIEEANALTQGIAVLGHDEYAEEPTFLDAIIGVDTKVGVAGVLQNVTGPASTHIGVFGSASQGTVNNWAGYFAGKTRVTGQLSVTDTTASVGQTSGCATFAGGIGIADEIHMGERITLNYPGTSATGSIFQRWDALFISGGTQSGNCEIFIDPKPVAANGASVDLFKHSYAGSGGGQPIALNIWSMDATPSLVHKLSNSGETVFNDNGNPSNDFRIETDTVSNAFFMDAGANTLGLNVATTMGAAFNPYTTASNPGGATTLWVNSADSNKLYFGASEVGGGGGVTFPLLASIGDPSIPEYSFAGATGSGMSCGDADELNLVLKGAQVLTLYDNVGTDEMFIYANSKFYGSTAIETATSTGASIFSYLTTGDSNPRIQITDEGSIRFSDGANGLEEAVISLDGSVMKIRAENVNHLELGLDDGIKHLSKDTFAGVSAPTVFTAGEGVIYFDSTANKFKVSEHAGAYVDLIQDLSAYATLAGASFTGAVSITGTNTISLNPDSGGFRLTAGGAGDSIMEVRRTGDTTYRYLVDSSGKVTFGTGTGAGDTNLYRASANVLKTDDTFEAVSGFKVGSGSTVTTILDEDDLVSDSATALATQQSTKAYVDNKYTQQAALTAEDVTAAGGADATLIENMRTRINELESKLQTLGFLA